MTGIYFWGLVIFAASVATLAWPLLRSGSKTAGLSAQDEGLLILRDRLLVQLENVERDRSDNTMDEAVASKEISRIELELAQVLGSLEKLQSAAEETSSLSPIPKWLMPLLAVVLLSGGLLYGFQFMEPVTHEDIKAHASRQDPQENPHAGMQGGSMSPQIMEMVKRLEEKMKTNPDNLDGWKRLARSYQVMGNIQGAYAALEQAYRLAPEDVDVVAHYAAVSFAVAKGNTEGKTGELFDKLLKLDPDNPSGLWFKGMAAFRKADYKQAILFWERTLKQIPEGDPGRQQVQQGIDEARRLQNAS